MLGKMHSLLMLQELVRIFTILLYKAVSRAFSGPGVANGLSLEVGTIMTLSFKMVAGSIPDGVTGIFH